MHKTVLLIINRYSQLLRFLYYSQIVLFKLYKYPDSLLFIELNFQTLFFNIFTIQFTTKNFNGFQYIFHWLRFRRIYFVQIFEGGPQNASMRYKTEVFVHLLNIVYLHLLSLIKTIKAQFLNIFFMSQNRKIIKNVFFVLLYFKLREKD